MYHRFLGGGGRLVTPQFQHGGPIASVVHDAHWQSGLCLQYLLVSIGQIDHCVGGLQTSQVLSAVSVPKLALAVFGDSLVSSYFSYYKSLT